MGRGDGDTGPHRPLPLTNPAESALGRSWQVLPEVSRCAGSPIGHRGLGPAPILLAAALDAGLPPSGPQAVTHAITGVIWFAIAAFSTIFAALRNFGPCLSFLHSSSGTAASAPFNRWFEVRFFVAEPSIRSISVRLVSSAPSPAGLRIGGWIPGPPEPPGERRLFHHETRIGGARACAMSEHITTPDHHSPRAARV